MDTQGEHHIITEAEIREMQLQTKEYQVLRAKEGFYPEAQRQRGPKTS